MPDPDLLFSKFVTKFNGVEVFRNRVVISEGTFVKTETTVLMRSIASVTLEGPAKFLKITTSDGKTHKATFMAGKVAEGAYQAILSVL